MNHLFSWKIRCPREQQQEDSTTTAMEVEEIETPMAPHSSSKIGPAAVRIHSSSSSAAAASSTPSISIAGIAAQIHERALLLERECEHVRLASEERDRLLQRYAQEQQQTQAVRMNSLEWHIKVHTAELEYNQILSEIVDYESKIGKIHQETVSLREKLKTQQEFWDAKTNYVLTQHFVVTEHYVKKLQGAIKERQDELCRKQKLIDYLSEKTNDFRQKSKLAVQGKHDLENQIVIISTEREKENRDIHDLADQVRDSLEKRAVLRTTLRTLQQRCPD